MTYIYMHFTMPSVIRVEKFEFLDYIPADLLLKIVCHLNNIQSYIVFVRYCSSCMWNTCIIPLAITCGSTWQVHSYSLVCAVKWSFRDSVVIPTIVYILMEHVHNKQIHLHTRTTTLPSWQAWHSGMVGIGCGIMPSISDDPLPINIHRPQWACTCMYVYYVAYLSRLHIIRTFFYLLHSKIHRRLSDLMHHIHVT